MRSSIILALVASLSLSANQATTTNTIDNSILYSKFEPLIGSKYIPLTESQYQTHYDEFIKKHNKPYHNNKSEYLQRYNIFKQNLYKIYQHNLHADAGLHTYRMGVNEHADMTWNEFKLKMKGYTHIEHSVYRSANTITYDKSIIQHVKDTVKEVDWVSKGVVSEVKNQGQCGSCWAFSATGSIESANAISTGKLVELSEQELVDCSTPEGNNGCNGGLMDYAFQWVIDNKGICAEQSYEYTASGPNQCSISCDSVVHISGFKDIPEGDEDSLLTAVATVGPISIAIEADQESFQFYSSGVLDTECGTQLDHGVLLVGYGTTEDGIDFWNVKNSWGASWGNQGYIKLIRGKNQCGVASAASYPIV